MLKVRIIPVLTFNGLGLVKTKQFQAPRMVGNPVQAARVFNSRGVDELIFLDIQASKQKRKINLKIVKDVIKECFMPVGIGGGITCLEDIGNLLKIGADKVVLKTIALENPSFVQEASHFYGSQCITISADVYRDASGEFLIHSEQQERLKLADFLRQMEDLGAGEIVLNSVDKEGLMQGFDLELVRLGSSLTQLPLIAVGGAGNLKHFEELFEQTSCQAVGASSIFHFTQYTPLDIKQTLKKMNQPVRL